MNVLLPFIKNLGVFLFVVVLTGCFSPSVVYSEAEGGCLPEQGQPSCFYKKASDHRNKKLIVFIHGIFGSGATSWGNPKAENFWPKVVTEDSRFRNYDIYLVSYKAPYFGGVPNIYEIAGNELGRLRSQKVFENYQEIYFVAHSMGGLVAKDMLVSLNRGDDLARLHRIKGVVYLGTPAQGADLAKLGAWLSMNPQLGNMEPSQWNAYLQLLEDQWVQLLQDRDMARASFPKAHCAYETLKTGPSIVVPRQMATSRCDGQLYPMPTDHSGLTTPTGQEDDPYLWAMTRILDEEQNVEVINRDAPAQSGNTRTLALRCEGGITTLKRRPEQFVSHWISALNSLRNTRTSYDLQNLFEVWGRVPVGLTGKDLVEEATFTISCLEKEGYLKVEKLDAPGHYWGVIFENQKIAFENR